MCDCHETEDYTPGEAWKCIHGTLIIIKHVDTLKSKREKNKREGRFKCETCSHCFQLKTGLKAHAARGCRPKKMHCEKCDATYSRSKWDKHLLTKKHLSADAEGTDDDESD